KYCQLLLQNRRGTAYRFFRINRTVGFKIDNQLVQVSPLFYTGTFYRVGNTADRAVRGIKLKTPDSTTLILSQATLVRRFVTTTPDNLEPHLDCTGLVQVADYVIRIDDLHIVIALNVASRNRAFAL